MIKEKINRREFIKACGMQLAGTSILLNQLSTKSAFDGQALSATQQRNFPMEYRSLGKTGLKVSVLSFGVMRLNEPAVLFKALETGINYFDTAHVYSKGKNEMMLGDVLKQYGRNKVLIATKIPFYRRLKEKNVLSDKATMEKKMEMSLKRLQTDYVDVLFLHAVNEPTWLLNDDVLAFIENQKKTGKARFVGISFHEAGQLYVDVAEQAIKSNVFDVLLAALNFKSPPAHIEVLSRAKKKNIGVIAMKTQAGGYQKGVQGLISPHQAALKWVLDKPFVDCAIPGMVNLQQLEENSGALGKRMGWSDRKILTAYYNAVKDRFCLRCGDCLSSCAGGVDIPAIQRSLMYWEGYRDFTIAQTAYHELPSTKNALVCMSCTSPTCTCVNGINIFERMRQAHSSFV